MTNNILKNPPANKAACKPVSYSKLTSFLRENGISTCGYGTLDYTPEGGERIARAFDFVKTPALADYQKENILRYFPQIQLFAGHSEYAPEQKFTYLALPRNPILRAWKAVYAERAKTLKSVIIDVETEYKNEVLAALRRRKTTVSVEDLGEYTHDRGYSKLDYTGYLTADEIDSAAYKARWGLGVVGAIDQDAHAEESLIAK